jgi:hypothetical protein
MNKAELIDAIAKSAIFQEGCQRRPQLDDRDHEGPRRVKVTTGFGSFEVRQPPAGPQPQTGKQITIKAKSPCSPPVRAKKPSTSRSLKPVESPQATGAPRGAPLVFRAVRDIRPERDE